jgi:hypothetical protein
MNTIDLPALDGRTALGFLAALGVLRLLDQHHNPSTALAWSPATATAILHSDLTDTQAVADQLAATVDALDDDHVIPGAPADLPLPKTGVGVDPMRVPGSRLRDLVEDLTTDRETAATARAWLAALLTDLADDKGRAQITPFAAPSGQQSYRTLFTKPLDLVRSDHHYLYEALVNWRRVDGYSGEYLDHRAIRSAAEHPSGASEEYGVPGATWLAIMALPLLRLTGNGKRTLATGWQRIEQRNMLVWPLWTQPLDRPAIQTLLEHPQLALTARDTKPEIDMRALAPLGIFTIGAATRRRIPGRNFAGVLTPEPVTLHHAT